MIRDSMCRTNGTVEREAEVTEDAKVRQPQKWTLKEEEAWDAEMGKAPLPSWNGECPIVG